MSIYDNNFWEWVDRHRGTDPIKLRLAKKHSDPDWIDDAIAQIENERRSRSKFLITGETELLPRLMPVSLSVEQASSARVARLHHDIAGLEHGSKVLDMTCGLGVDASLLARDPSVMMTAVDLNKKIADVAAYNFKDRPNITVLNADSVEWLKKTEEHFDLIFIDPARRDDSGGRVYNIHDCTPDVTLLLPLLRARSKLIMVKMSPMLDVTQTLRDLPGTRELWSVAERGECRELLALIDSNEHHDPEIKIWNDGAIFTFTAGEEAEAQAKCRMPEVGMYLLEPSAATMKAGPFRLLCRRFNAFMIHHNTHLYTSDKRTDDFPGRNYEITEVIPYTSGHIRQLARKRIQADVATRNFPISADSLRTRLGIKKSGKTRITGITATDDRQYIIFAEKIEP